MKNIQVSQDSNVYTCTLKVANKSGKIQTSTRILKIIVEDNVYVMIDKAKTQCAYPAGNFAAADAKRIAMVSECVAREAIKVKSLA